MATPTGIRGLYADAQRHLELALKLRRNALDEQDQNTPDKTHKTLRDDIYLRTANDLISVYEIQGKLTQAEFSRRGPSDSAPQARTCRQSDTPIYRRHVLAILYAKEGKCAQAESLYSEAVDSSRELSGGHLFN